MYLSKDVYPNICFSCPPRYLIYPGVSVDSASHAGFNNSTIYTLRSFITAWIVLLIAWVISVTFCNCSHWNMDYGPYLKYEMTWWHNRLHKYRRNLMESIAEVVLLKSGELTSEVWTPSRKVMSSEEENDLENILDAACSKIFFASVFRKFWWRVTRVLILAWVRFWPLQMHPPLPISTYFEGKEWSGMSMSWREKLGRHL